MKEEYKDKTKEQLINDLVGLRQRIAELEASENERKRAEKELRLFSQAADSSPDGIAMGNFEGRITYVNETFVRMFGYSKEELIGKEIASIYSKDQIPKLEEALKATMEGGWKGELLGKRKNGELFPMAISSAVVMDEKGRVIAHMASHRDITECKQAEEEVKKSRKFLDTIIENIPDPIYIKDRQFRFVEVNKAFYHTHKVTKGKGEILGEPRYRETDEEVFKTGKKFENPEQHYTDAEGNQHWTHLKKVPLTDESGNITHVLTISHDVTERKRAEEERGQLLQELRDKNTELERFTYTVSHDLRSPLITVQGFVEMLREDFGRDEKEKVESDLKFIETGTAKMEHLLNDTLRLSRIGRMVNPPEDVPFGEIVQEALQQAAQEIKLNGVEITVAEDFPAVHVDRMRIAEVLVNLITNSINYMGEQPRPKIDIGYRVDGEETAFFVQDNGIGIDKSQHEKVFELFYTVDKSGKGTGAGLAIVKRIIEVHNGRIWIESEKGKGCTVCFTLPVA